MFDHILGQPATAQLIADVEQGRLPPSILLAGPAASGKGTTALELARVLSCTGSPLASAGCDCASCVRQRLLSHPDLLCLGARDFSTEIAAAADAFTQAAERVTDRIDDVRNAESRERAFVRSIKKLLARFAVVLWEDDPKFGKYTALILMLEEEVEEINALKESGAETVRKRCAAIVKDAVKLEAEGITDTVSINQIRRVSAWARLAPNGIHKVILIENADRMQDGARNSLLKILEEPPEAVTIILTTCHEQALLPTILSRIRPYRFVQRPPEIEAKVIRQVFGTPEYAERAESGHGPVSITAYLKAFLPVSDGMLRSLSAYFAASAAMTTAVCLRRSASALPGELVALGTYTASIAEAAGLGRPVKNTRILIEKLLTEADNFEIRGLFSRFLQILLALVGESLSSVQPGNGMVSPAYLDIWRVCVAETGAAAGTYNQKPAAALTSLITGVRQAMTELWMT
ncbi:MAG: DNA polymerase III [Treponema sp.]|jgi:DNA polymerase-3 subunit gamma/tau|nr:DNA polymerase III [Treponema sp.]